MSEQIRSILAFVENGVACLFRDASPAKESSLKTKVILLIQEAVHRALLKGFQSASSYLAVKKTVKNVHPSPQAPMQSLRA